VNTIRAILVDDEESARNILKNLLLRFCPSVEVLASYKNVQDAVEGIKTFKPDLVFLDIEMPNYAGYEIVKFFDNVNFEIIFVTAYDQYAIKAFEVSAVDYLLKPIEIERLKESVQRVLERKNKTLSNTNINHLTNALQDDLPKSIIVSDKGLQEVVSISSIIAIEAQESYSHIYTTDKRYVVSKNLKHFESMLCEHPKICRTHKSWIVNLDHLVNYSKSNFEINLSNGMTAKLSKYKKADFEAAL
jgi:two-component system LytT family response regulator